MGACNGYLRQREPFHITLFENRIWRAREMDAPKNKLAEKNSSGVAYRPQCSSQTAAAHPAAELRGMRGAAAG